MLKKLILFDIGGVLRDSRIKVLEATKYGFRQAETEFNLDENEVWYLRGITPLHPSKNFIGAYLNIGEKMKQLLELSFDEAKKQAYKINKEHPKTAEIKKAYKEYFNSPYAPKAKEVPSNRYEFLMELKSMGLKIGVVSNAGKGSIKRDLKDEYDLFDIVIGEEDVKEKKPSPEGIIKALTALKIKPEQAIYIGDTEVDLLASKEAKIDFYSVRTGMVKESWWKELGFEPLKDAAEIIKIIDY